MIGRAAVVAAAAAAHQVDLQQSGRVNQQSLLFHSQCNYRVTSEATTTTTTSAAAAATFRAQFNQEEEHPTGEYLTAERPLKDQQFFFY